MRSKIPAVPTVMLTVMGLFHAIAGLASLVPTFVKDRVAAQFVPVWTFLTKPIYGDAPNDGVVEILAVASQIIIGVSELAIGGILLAAAIVPGKRLFLTNLGLSYAAGLFGAFLLTMFAMHDHSLPKWNQYPGILAWIGVTWLIVTLSEQSRVQQA